MRIIVSDNICLVDLRKASLLEAFLAMRPEILAPNTLLADGLLKFTPAQKKDMISAGMKAIDLPGSSVLRAREILLANPQLSVHEGLAYVLAEQHNGSVVLTGNDGFRAFVNSNTMTAQGVLWVVDEIHKNGHAAQECHRGLVALTNDLEVRVSRRDLAAAVKRFAALR